MFTLRILNLLLLVFGDMVLGVSMNCTLSSHMKSSLKFAMFMFHNLLPVRTGFDDVKLITVHTLLPQLMI